MADAVRASESELCCNMPIVQSHRVAKYIFIATRFACRGQIIDVLATVRSP